MRWRRHYKGSGIIENDGLIKDKLIKDKLINDKLINDKLINDKLKINSRYYQ